MSLLKRKSSKRISRRKPIKKKKNSRLLEMAIVAIFGLVVIYAASFAIRITHGFSKAVENPEYQIRIQILNGCGADGAAGQVARALPEIIKMPLDITIIEVKDFDAYHVAESFLINRHNDMEPIRILADQLNLDKHDIIYEPIENNYQSITVTLIIGDDYRRIWGDDKQKENI